MMWNRRPRRLLKKAGEGACSTYYSEQKIDELEGRGQGSATPVARASSPWEPPSPTKKLS
jgi:hypothetical protein